MAANAIASTDQSGITSSEASVSIVSPFGGKRVYSVTKSFDQPGVEVIVKSESLRHDDVSLSFYELAAKAVEYAPAKCRAATAACNLGGGKNERQAEFRAL